MKNCVEESLRRVQGWTLARQISVLGCAIAVMTGFLLSQMIKKIEFNYLMDRAASRHNEIFTTFSSACIEAVIMEDIPILRTVVGQFTDRTPDLHRMIIRNEDNAVLLEWGRNKDIPMRHLIKTSRNDLVWEGEKFGDVEMGWNMDRTYSEVKRHAHFVWLLISLSIVLPFILLLLCINGMVISPLGVINKKLLAVLHGSDIQGSKLEASRELNNLDQAVYRLDETMKLIRLRERELQTTAVSRDYLDKIIQGISDALVVVDSHALIKTANSAVCSLLGYAREELAGKPFSSLVADKYFVEEKLLSSQSDLMKNYELDYVRKDGRRIPMYFASTKLHAANSHAHDIVCIAKDMTERKKFENQLMELNHALMNNEKNLSKTLADLQKAHEELKQTQSQLLQQEKMASLGHWAAGVAREINNPLGFISSNMETMQKHVANYSRYWQAVESLKRVIEDNNKEQARLNVDGLRQLEKDIDLSFMISNMDDVLRESQAGIERIKKIVLDLCAFAREGQDTVELVRIEEVMDGILNIVYSEIQRKAEIEKEYGETPFITCSPLRLGQVFMNLLVNAAQSIKERGTIRVKTYARDACVYIEVSDTGEGVDDEQMRYVCDPVYTTQSVGKGVGLGLSTSYDIVRWHKGEITVQSKAGQGTTVTIRLPMEGGATPLLNSQQES